VSRHGLLTPLQEDVLQQFFAVTTGFVLTGGAALAGFYTGHRTTTDLDLFTFDDASFASAALTLQAIAHQNSWRCHTKSSSPAFVRIAVERITAAGNEVLLVDVVRDHSPQLGQPPVVVDGIALDPLLQIFINKLTALVGREEIRDVVDVMVLEQGGIIIEQQLSAALDKDGGCTPATLAWLLDGWADRIPPAVDVLGHSSDTIVTYMRTVARRMRAQSAPKR
jgi:Nucleotidyl transferase AbiEii toxin, Type IV TA system